MNVVEGHRHRREWISRVWHTVWPGVVLALLCAAFFWDALWLPADRTIMGDDLTNMFLHWLRFAISSIRQGQIPLWNPYLFSGLPFIANPQPALFYPPMWLALLVPAIKALDVIAVLHLWLAGVGMYAWLRSEKASAAGALFGAIVFAFSGYFFVRVRGGHIGVVTTGAWLPLLLWAYRRIVESRSWKLAVVGGLPVGLSILAGHTASFIYVALALVAYAVFCTWERWREQRPTLHSPSSILHSPFSILHSLSLPLIWVGVMLLVGLALAAVQLLPMAELAMRSTRQAVPGYDFAARFSWPPGYLLTLLVPNFFGEPTHTGYWGDGIYDEFIFYIGILPLLLALLGLRLRHRLTPFLVALGLGALLLAFGQYAILHRLFYRFVPLFRMARAPARAGFLFTLAGAALSGLTVTALQSSAREERTRLLAPLRWPPVLTLAGGALALVVTSFVAFAWGREAHPAAGRLWHIANQAALFLFFFLLATSLLAAWRDVSRPRAGLWLLALGLAVLDLWTLGGGLIEIRDVEENAYWRIVAQAVPDPQAARVLPWGLSDFEQNGGIPFGLRSVFGYDPLTLQRYEEFITSRPDPRARTYDLLNAGYLVTTVPQEFPDGPDAPHLLLEQSGVYVYERPTALPQAWVVQQIEVLDDAQVLARIHDSDFDPRTTALAGSALECEGTVVGEAGEVEIVRYEGSRIEARVRGGGGLLVFSEVEYPGWQATVDGIPAHLVRANYLLRALCVPAGAHRVVLVYDPPLLKLGLAVTALTLLFIIGVAIWTARRNRGPV
ncbi:MAG: YfhO family protein [Chloroflexota bacterium]|nr:YfhO family protein [Chloroflexota bacterium]